METQTGKLPARSVAAETGVGTVELGVTDGTRALQFYRDVVGLTPLPSDGDRIVLGAAGRSLVELLPGAARPVEPHTTGLYHLALLVPSRRELARAIGRHIQLRVATYPTDHVMTKSTYLWDPDGNGIEIYVESPEDGTWFMGNGTFAARDKDGRLRSGRDPIDVPQLLSELTPDDRLDAPLPEASRMGHVHLHVGDIDEALRFYHDLIGFDVMGSVPEVGMAFVSAGGYHHHLGLNTWAGVGAPPAPPNAAGLRHFTIELPTEAELTEVSRRLTAGGVSLSEDSRGLFASDPSHNRVRLIVK